MGHFALNDFAHQAVQLEECQALFARVHVAKVYYFPETAKCVHNYLAVSKKMRTFAVSYG